MKELTSVKDPGRLECAIVQSIVFVGTIISLALKPFIWMWNKLEQNATRKD